MGCFGQDAYSACMPLFSVCPGSAFAYPDGDVNAGAALGCCSWMRVRISCCSPHVCIHCIDNDVNKQQVQEEPIG